MRPVVELIANLTLAWQMRAPGAGRNTDANRRLAPSPATAGGSGTDGVSNDIVVICGAQPGAGIL